jgi:hypothetical protein
MTFKDWVGAILGIVQISAIVVGAVWAYYKFAKGRLFASRAEPTVAGELIGDAENRGIIVTVALKNAGTTKLQLRSKTVYVYAVSAGGWPGAEWDEVAHRRVLDEHDWLEGQEMVTEQILIPLPSPSGDARAYRLQFRVFQRRKEPGGLQWTAEAIMGTESGASAVATTSS